MERDRQPCAPETPAEPQGAFRTTMWTEVSRAQRGQDTEALEALGSLCRRYWHPIYSYVRRRGNNVHDAQDLTQGFFSRLLEKGHLQSADSEKGKFRSFLLTSLKWYLSHEWGKAKAEKRGGKAVTFSLDDDTAEERFQAEAAGTGSPEESFDRQYARVVLERAMARLMKEHDKTRFEALSRHLMDGQGELSYTDSAEVLGLSEGAVKVAVIRMRQRYGQLFRQEVSETMEVGDDVDAEVRHLLRLLGGASGAAAE